MVKKFISIAEKYGINRRDLISESGYTLDLEGRILDCSFGAAKKLGFVSEGVAPVKIEIKEWGDGEYMHHRKLKK